ncbi:Mu transposase domain-containing protein [Nocardia sp. KC 131]|uniref:Mu transposase domain-containing protein n=1 Tax=Nocardia arseniciresistens TaxID=3392119 RepID=UPI00398ED67D
MFATDEAPKLKPLPDTVFDVPTWVNPKVAPDRHVQISQALYSIPGDLVGQRLSARVDSQTVKLYLRGELIKVHPKVGPGRRQTDPADLPSELTAYAMRDLNTLQRKAFDHGVHVGSYAAAVLEHRLPWTKMRQVYRLLGLVRRHGADAVDDACRRALDAEVVDVGVIDRMLARGATGQQLMLLSPPAPSRFVRSTTDFSVRRPS